MSLTLLEKQGTIQYPRSGALLNFHALGRQNGRLYGCQLVQSTSELIVLTTGVLVIQGFRVDVVDETVFNASLALKPATPLRYYIILRIEAGLEDTEMELLVTDEAPVNDTPIEERQGVFDYVLGVFNFGPAGISEFISLIETIKDRIPNTAETDGVRWFDGLDVSGIEEPIICNKELVQEVDLGDYYLNNSNGNYYKCIEIGEQYAYWEYKGNLKGPKGEQGESSSLDNYYTKSEVDTVIEQAIITALTGDY